MTMIYGRRVIMTKLDPIPPAFRTVPCYIAMNQRELDAFNACDPEVFKQITDICHAADNADGFGVYKHPRWKPPKQKSTPSNRMHMLNTILSRR